MDRRIVRFLKRHHVMSLAVEGPWSAAVFYAFDEERQAFVYASGPETLHAQRAVENPEGSGSIVLETRMVGRLQGMQLRGRTWHTEEEWARKVYLKRFPFAAAMTPELWVLEPAYMKYTDNTLGFGKKLVWEKK